ncbi:MULTISPECIES: TM0106 family RecB-like putative nuclease [Petrotoga]|uniref:YprB ribonuclease H-like domain-containing protein n=2 Tax=Petrotoga sibirica TaxID=156202 RepID=A0A4R8EM69_9BACT|nr:MULTISPECIES: TM0106 family RecB-like putative nuclease [Petrotoga]KUK81677.1 MAG: Nuclease (RecB family)-like protein [Petrotoga mobilis]POZ88643.1 hypothetical protein AA80_04905 [Petrotoga sibirica DSM 13575]POZ90716.1 hypothetical protein AD60_05715 [Petrotoga sp. SL27]TDX13260.1 uncharacterized protein C8D74_11131 [Petrotoga sibirica]
MDLLYYENFKSCSYFVPTYKRQGSYFDININGLNVEANYESINNGVVKIVRMGNNFKKSYWLHIYTVYKYFKDKGKPIKRIVLETSNGSYEINVSDILLREKWITKELNYLKSTKKVHGPHCKFCKIKNQCHLEFLMEGDYSIVPNLSKSMVEDLKNMNLDPLTVIKTNQIEKLDKKFKKPLYNLKSLIENQVHVIDEYSFPQDYIVFDVETYLNKDFLFGFLENETYVPFFLGKNGYQNAVKMVDFLYEKDKVLLHYDKNDLTALKKLSFKYPILRDKLNKISSKTCDLYEIIRKNYSLPVVSYSLKDISKYFGFDWKTELNGFAVILEYKSYLNGNKNALKNIFKYNEDDCRATKLVLESLKAI